MQVKTLWDLGKNKTEIARLTGHDWKTVAKVIKAIENGIEKLRYRSSYLALLNSSKTREIIFDFAIFIKIL